jgi:TPP-dependent pyruvate/acetoin dehydrogenase alpha subunit
MKTVPKEVASEMLRKMFEIRKFEETIVDQYARGNVPGVTHLYIGEEAVAVGACMNLGPEDYITSTHRGHGHCIAKGGELKPMMAELFGKKTGYCKGKGGSMHIASFDKGILGAMGIVGSGVPIATGGGLGIKLQGLKRVVVCFFGDNASNTGASHEGLNLASVLKVPVVFICENNLYGISVPQHKHQAIKDIAIRAAGYNMPGVIVDGMDVVAVYEKVGKAVKRAREGGGPTLIECKTYRFRGHMEGDPNLGTRYRTKEEIETWVKRCPIKLFKERLVKERIMKEAEIQKLEEDVDRRIKEAFDYAKESPFPEIEEMYKDVFVEA